MGVGLVRSLQPLDILLIHWRVYNSIANTSKWVLFSTPFWCLCRKLSLSPLYFNKTLLHKSSEWSSLISGPGLNSSPPEAKNPGVSAWFSNNLSGRYPLYPQSNTTDFSSDAYSKVSKLHFCFRKVFQTSFKASNYKYQMLAQQTQDSLYLLRMVLFTDMSKILESAS